MVNTTTDSMASSLPLFSVSPSKLSKLNNDNFIQSISSSLFNLSKPFNLSHKLKSKNDSSLEYSQASYASSFTFPEPFESYHAGSGVNGGGGGKLLSKNTKRSQPYSLSKPSKPNISRQENSSNSFSLSNSSSSSNGNVSSDRNHQQNSNNPILSRLSNISNSLKSIFVRPKHSKPVDLGSFNHGSSETQSTSQNDQSEGTKFKINLFSVNPASLDIGMNGNSEPFGHTSINSSSMQADMSQKLEKIISRNIMLESYTNKMSKASTTVSQVSTSMSPLRKGPKHSETSSSISSMSSNGHSNELLDSNGKTSGESLRSTSHHQRALQMSSKNNCSLIKQESSSVRQQIHTINTNGNKSTPNKGTISKWTCMVCLSKHTIDVKICSICGSSNSDSVNKTPVQLSIKNAKLEKSSKKLFNDINESLMVNSPLRSLNNNIGGHGSVHLKTWKCNDCNFANDNLKIVCMNCRASKKQNSQALEQKFGHQTLQTKRKPLVNQQFGYQTLGRNNRYKMNKSNEENEQGSDNEFEERQRERSKRSRKHESVEQLCKSCKNCLGVPKPNVEDAKTPTMCGEYAQKKSTDTPLRPKFLETPTTEGTTSEKTAAAPAENAKDKQADMVRPNSLIFANMTKTAKWSCSTCLVSNDADKSACVCCQTKRPSTITESATEKTTTTTTITNKPVNSLFAAASTSSSKWSCSTCLVSNDADKTACACCKTKRPGANTTSTETAPKQAAVNALFKAAAANASKWACSTCLTNNDNDKTACACCQTKKPGIEEAPKNSLFITAGLKAASSSAKWSCSTCLVSNDADKNACVCCSTDKPGSAGGGEDVTKTKFSSLVAAAGTLSNTSSSISFGLNAAKPSDGGISFSSSGFGLKTVDSEKTTGITFGAASGMAAPVSFGSTSTSTSGFSFGAKKEDMAKPASTGGFSFEANTEEAKPASNDKPSFLAGSNPFSNQVDSQKDAEGKKTFGFQVKQEDAPSKPSFGSGFGSSTTTEAAKPAFGFGSASGTTEAAKPAFGFVNSTATTTEAAKPAFGFGSASGTTEAAKPAFGSGFGSSSGTTEAAKPAFSGFGNSSTTEAAKPVFGTGFGSSTTISEASKPAFGSGFGSSSTTTEPAKPTFSGFGSSTTTEAPKSAFGFGNSTSSSESQKPAFGSTTKSETSTNMFCISSTTKPVSSTTPFAFGGSSTTIPAAPTTPSAFNFGGSAPSTNTTAFGAASSTTTTTTSSTTNVFGQLNQNSASTNSNNKSSAFNFGGSNVTQSPAPFQFGGNSGSSSQKVNDENKPLAFNFGGSNTSSGFNFGGANSTDSPLKLPAVQQPAGGGSPFVFGGATNNNRATDSPSLAQVLTGPPSTPSTTASGRPIKKATRMRKK